MRADERDAGYLWDMLEAARETRQLLHGYALEKLLADARTRRAGADAGSAGRSRYRVSAPVREVQSRIPWAKIIGQRNVIAHGYAVVDHSRLFRTVTQDLPGLIADLERIVKALETDPE